MKQWHFVQNDEQVGPVEETYLRELAATGALDRNALVWTEGMTQWAPLHTVGDLCMPLPGQESTGPLFLYIPVGRLIVLSILSFGLYEAYWIFNNWRYLKRRDGLKIRPFWRGIFGVFYCHSIMRAISQDAQTNAKATPTFSPGKLAAGWIFFTLVFGAVGRIGDEPVLYYALSLLFFPSFLFLVPVQQYINRVNEISDPPPPYYSWSLGHWVCLLSGLCVWSLYLLGLLVEVLVLSGVISLEEI